MFDNIALDFAAINFESYVDFIKVLLEANSIVAVEGNLISMDLLLNSSAETAIITSSHSN